MTAPPTAPQQASADAEARPEADAPWFWLAIAQAMSKVDSAPENKAYWRATAEPRKPASSSRDERRLSSLSALLMLAMPRAPSAIEPRVAMARTNGATDKAASAKTSKQTSTPDA